MRNLDFSLISVQELDAFEMKDTDGGWIWPLVFGYIVLQACLNPQAHIDAFKEGWDMYDN